MNKEQFFSAFWLKVSKINNSFLVDSRACMSQSNYWYFQTKSTTHRISISYRNVAWRFTIRDRQLSSKRRQLVGNSNLPVSFKLKDIVFLYWKFLKSPNTEHNDLRLTGRPYATYSVSSRTVSQFRPRSKNFATCLYPLRGTSIECIAALALNVHPWVSNRRSLLLEHRLKCWSDLH